MTVNTRMAVCAAMLTVAAIAGFAQAANEPQPFQAGRPPLKVRPSGDKAIIMTVADALGFVRGVGPRQTTEALNRLQWLGSGRMSAEGRSYVVDRYSYALSLGLKGAREDIQRTAPDGRKERVVRAFLGGVAWDESAPGIDARSSSSSNAAYERRLQYLRTPFGFTQALLRADAASVKVKDPGSGGSITISANLDGVPVDATLDAYYRPALISMRVYGQLVETRYSRYRDIAEYGVMFPTRIVESVNGQPSLNLTIDDARVASYLILQPPGTAPAAR